MPNSLRLNGHEVGLADHPTVGTSFVKGGLDSRVEVRCGSLYINLLTPSLDLTPYLPAGAPAEYAVAVDYIRLVTYQAMTVPGGRYGQRLTLPDKSANRQTLEVYGLPGYEQFHGTIEVREGQLLLEGAIRSENFALPLSARVSFPATPLLPARATHTLESAREEDPVNVFNLRIDEGTFSEFPVEILGYKNLESLFIGGRAQLSATTLPATLGELRRLHTLLIYQHQLTELPPTLGNLSSLEELSLYGGELTRLPGELGRLTSLRKLDLAYNRLESLPEAVARLPNLRSLDIRGNRFTELPAALADAYSVRIDHKYKKLYTDTTYPTRHPGPIDPALYDLSAYLEDRAQLAATIDRQPDLAVGKDLLLRYTRMATYLVPMPTDGTPPLGASRLGGAPDLPLGRDHPADKNGLFYTFHAQLNCAELAPFQRYLPRAGILYFFVNDEEYAQRPLVLYSERTDQLRRIAYTDATRFIDLDMNGNYREPQLIRPVNALSLPELYACQSYGAERYPATTDLFSDESDAAIDRVEALEEAIQQLGNNYPGIPRHKFPFIERPYHALNTYVFTQHESPEEQAAARFGGEPGEWCVLLNLESIGEFSFWDAGTLTYCIHKRDLAAADFSTIFASIESS